MPTRESQPTLFATTRWTLVHDAARDGDASASAALGALAGIYWQPLYRYARRKGKSKEDAEDLVQGFLARLINARKLREIERTKGRFRAFLLASFNHWMINEWRRGSREKRGGGVFPISLDWESAETGLAREIIADDRSPDKLFDREWALTLLGNVFETLEAASRAEGNAKNFELLKPCLTADSSRLPYTEIALKLQTTEGAARVAVHRLRKRYRHLLTEEIARTLSPTGSVEEEMQSLLSALAE